MVPDGDSKCGETARRPTPIEYNTPRTANRHNGASAVTVKPNLSTDRAPLFCARCAAELRPGTGSFFQVTIEAVADPAPPVLPAPEPDRDLRQEIKKLIAQLEDVSAQEAMDQVIRRLVLH